MFWFYTSYNSIKMHSKCKNTTKNKTGGVRCCRMSRSWHSVVDVLRKASECRRRRRWGVPTRCPTNLPRTVEPRASYSGRSVCHVRFSCQDRGRRRREMLLRRRRGGGEAKLSERV
ncbi:unnamed protein product [Ixodes pacificus]